jgi:hypothetical protein
MARRSKFAAKLSVSSAVSFHTFSHVTPMGHGIHSRQNYTATMKLVKKVKAIIVTAREGPQGSEMSRLPSFSRQSAHRQRCGCQPYAPAVLYPPKRFMVLISVKG